MHKVKEHYIPENKIAADLPGMLLLLATNRMVERVTSTKHRDKRKTAAQLSCMMQLLCDDDILPIFYRARSCDTYTHKHTVNAEHKNVTRTVLTAQRPGYNIHSTVSMVQGPQYSVQLKTSTVQCLWYRVHSTVSRLQHPWHSVHSTVSMAQCPWYRGHGTVSLA